MVIDHYNQLNKIFQAKGRFLALDVGSKRIGLAISDDSKTIATPKLVIERQSNVKDFTKIKNIIDENQVIALIIGVPNHQSDNQMSEFVKKFSTNLDEFLSNKLPTFFVDETLTSFEARRFSKSSKNSKFCDDIAASLILQDFIDNQKTKF